MKSRKHILILILMAAAFAGWAQGNNEFTIPLSDPTKRGKLKAHLNTGSITIKGTARKDILVKYSAVEDDDDDDDRGRKNGNKNGGKEAEGKEGLKKIGGGGIELDASENGNFVKVSSGSWNTKMNLDIEVPSGIDLQVSTHNDGDLMVTNIQGEVEMTNYNGPITALTISGSVVATTYNGDVKATFDKVTEGKPMSFFTYNGDVDLGFPAVTKATFKMKTDQGEIYTGFEMNVKSSGPEKIADPKGGGYKLKIDEWKRGEINGGGAEITVKTYNGDIYIRKK